MSHPLLTLKARVALQALVGEIDNTEDVTYTLQEVYDALDDLEERLAAVEDEINTAVTGILARLTALEEAP